MKAYLLCALMLGTSLHAEITPEQRAKVLEATAGIVKEKVDDFEKVVRLSYSGKEIHLPTAGTITASVLWSQGHLQQPTFLIAVTRVDEGWRWLKYHAAKMLVDGERVEWKEHDLESDVLDGGRVYEAKMMEVSLRQVMEICAAQMCKMKLGADEWELDESRRLPMVAVLAAWIGRGGDVSAYEGLKRRIFHPGAGMPYAEVVKKFGEPVWKDPQDGWATWEWFWLRFKDGQVCEARTRPLKEKAAQ